MDEVIYSAQTSNITEDDKLKCGALVITELLGINKKEEEGRTILERIIESNIDALHKDVSFTERWETGMLRKENQKTRLNHLYQLKRKKHKRASEELKQ